MSFSSKLKEELCEAKLSGKEAQRAFVYGAFLFAKGASSACLQHTTEHLFIVEALKKQLRAMGGIPFHITSAQHGETLLYTGAVPYQEKRDKLLALWGYQPGEEFTARITDVVDSEEDTAAFLRGAFLTCGSITDPEKEYHMEFVVPNAALCNALLFLVREAGIPAKTTKRKNSFIIYIKESEQIEDLMTFMGGSLSALHMMNVKILKDVRNQVNRVTNCETANIDKTVIAAANQIEDINYIIQNRGIEYIPDHLRELAELRLENPDVSFAELAAMLTSPISKSGVSHRLRKLSQLAKELREEEA